MTETSLCHVLGASPGAGQVLLLARLTTAPAIALAQAGVTARRHTSEMEAGRETDLHVSLAVETANLPRRSQRLQSVHGTSGRGAGKPGCARPLTLRAAQLAAMLLP